MIEVTMPRLSVGQEESWLALLELSRRIPNGWCVVGGQMVHMHCQERGVTPSRPTDDGDAMLDLRTEPQMLYRFTEVLYDLAFRPDGETDRGHQHRWTRGEAKVDVLIPDHMGERTETRKGYLGGTTIAAPGARSALDRAEQVQVTVAGTTGLVWRPRLAGAIAAKAAALSIVIDPKWKRHLTDIAVLSTLIRRGDLPRGEFSKTELSRINNALGRIVQNPDVIVTVEGAANGLERLRLSISS